MRLVVNRHQSLDSDVRVALGRRQRGMAQKLLDSAKVGARSEHVRGKRVTQGVRRDVGGDRSLKHAAIENPPRAPIGQACAAEVQKQRVGIAPTNAQRLGRGQPREERRLGLSAERDDALLVSLSQDAYEAARDRESESLLQQVKRAVGLGRPSYAHEGRDPWNEEVADQLIARSTAGVKRLS